MKSEIRNTLMALVISIAVTGCSRSVPLGLRAEFVSNASPSGESAASSAPAADSSPLPQTPGTPVDAAGAAAILEPAADHRILPFRTEDSPALRYAEPNSSPVVQVSDDTGEFGAPATEAAEQGAAAGFQLSITDAPINGVDSMRVRFVRAEIAERAGGAKVSLLAAPLEVDLLSLRDGISRLFGSVSLAPGVYHGLRFWIDRVSVQFTGASTPVEVAIPEALARDGIRLFGTFEIKAGSAAQVTIDFDASRFLVPGKHGWLLRPLAKLRHLRFNPAGIHLEEAADGTLSLVGPKKSVRPRAWVQLTDQLGGITRQRVSWSGSFRLDGIPRILGPVELAVVERRHVSDGRRWDDDDDSDDDRDHRGRARFVWKKIAWMSLLVDFAADQRFPRILASHLQTLMGAAFEAAGRDPSVFLSGFGTAPFRTLAALFLRSTGRVVPGDFVMPELPVPYAFGLEGPDYDLPGYAHEADALNLFTGGPAGGGCSDAKRVFEGPAPNNDYSTLPPESAVRRMVEARLPFTGLLAEYEAVCKGRDLAELGCQTLGALGQAGNLSLPAIPLSGMGRVLNSPRGGLITGLLACSGGPPAQLGAVPVPQFPVATPGCWYGCKGGPKESYLAASELLGRGEALKVLGTVDSVTDLDSLVLKASAAGVAPLVLLSSYVADESPSKVHGFSDRNAPEIMGLLPLDGTEVTVDHIAVSGVLRDRTSARVSINGEDAVLSEVADGSLRFGPLEVGLVDGLNSVEVQAFDEAGNIAIARIEVKANLPRPVPTPTPTPTPIPTPTPTPTPVPSVVPAPGVSDLCQSGQFAPKARTSLALSIDTANTSSPAVINGLSSLGFPLTVYTDSQVIAGKPASDGATVLVISRKVGTSPLSQAYVDSVRAFVAQGGSLVGEYDGAALAFTAFGGTHPMIPNLTPPLSLFTGYATGGGALLPISQSTLYVSDPGDPIMAGMPSSYLSGVRAAFAVSDYNASWLHASGTFVSIGTNGLLPVGTFPAVLSGRCGSSRVALFTMNHFSLLSTGPNPATLMTGNAMRWVTGQ